ncbi:MAG: nucleotidyl transferase AbiEii/AbiGii toxin family protein [Bacilli bacterium]|jgi:hypothetical protein
MEFKNSNQLKGYLKVESKHLNIHSNHIYTMYFTRQFLNRLTKENQEDFVIKGSYAQLANIKRLTRPLTDIDATSPRDLLDSSYLLEKIISKKDDPITYKMKEKFITTRETAAFKIKCNFDKIEHMIKFDLKQDNNHRFIQRTLPKVFKKDQPFDIKCATIEQHLSNKMYVILREIVFNQETKKKLRRFKDYYDVYQIIKEGSFNEGLIRGYLKDNIEKYQEIDERVFKQYLFEEEFILKHEEEYQEEAKRLGFKEEVSFKETVKSMEDLIKTK